MEMGEKSVSQALFDPSGGTQKASTPDIAENADGNCDRNHNECVEKQLPAFDPERGQVVDDPLDDAGDEKLKYVNRDQTE